jgi:hypothetical protein
MTSQLKSLLRDVTEWHRFQARLSAGPYPLAADGFERKVRLVLAGGPLPKPGSVGADVLAQLRAAIASLRS